jgi:hypothetical protein
MRGYKHNSRLGPVYIVPKAGRWHIIFNEEDLGSYHSPEAAADDAAGGHTFTPSNGVDLDRLNLSDNLGDWEAF